MARRSKTAPSTARKVSIDKLAVGKLRLIILSVLTLVVGAGVLLGLNRAVDLAQASLSIAEASSQVLVVEGQPQEVAALTVQVPTSKGVAPPPLSAASVVVEDLASGAMLYARDANTRVPIASTTKIMTALVGLNYFTTDSVLTVSPTALVGGSSMGLQSGEKVTFRTALYGLLLNSGNDAAYTIAENYPGGADEFLGAMNKTAASLGLVNTHFDNPAGFDSPYHYSSAADLAKIAAVAETNAQLARVVATRDAQVTSVDRTSTHSLRNLNRLLGLPGVLGMKTGTTPAARENLVTVVERNDHKILLVVLGSDDRFRESRALIDWTFNNFLWAN